MAVFLDKKTLVSWIPNKKGASAIVGDERAFLVKDVKAQEVIKYLDNNGYVGQYQNDKARVGGRYGEISFSTEFVGGVPGAIPAHGRLLRACAFNEIEVGSSDETYTYTFGGSPRPYSVGNLDAVTLRINEDTLERHFDSCAGNAKFTWEAGQVPMIAFSFRGLLPSTLDNSHVSIAEQGSLKTFADTPFPVAGQNYSASINGVGALNLLSCTYDIGNSINENADLNGQFGYSAPYITSYNPVITLSIRATGLSTINPELLALNRTEVAVAFTHNDGGAAGEEAAVSFDCYFKEVELVNNGGLLTYNITAEQSITSGATPLTIAWT